jgi:hypothetical protein
MLYLVYAVVGVEKISWPGEIEREDWTSCSYMIIELRTKISVLGGDGTSSGETGT